MKTSVFTKLALTRSRAAGIAAVALAACGAALAATPAQAGYNFETKNDPADQPFMGATFTNLLGITTPISSLGSTAAGRQEIPTQGSC
jgi:hypothetical protein